MTTSTVSKLALAALVLLTTPGRAQQQPPAVRQIGPISAVSKDSLSSVAAAVQVSDGRVFVNDIAAHRVLLYDSTLGSPTVVADSTAGSANAYGPRPGTLLPYRGDSALFITPAALSMLVLSPEGRITRTMAMPPAGGGLPALLGNIFGTPGFDARGRLAYFSPVRLQLLRPPTPGQPIVMEPPDSAFIVRFDFPSRTLDTAGTIRIARTKTNINRDDAGKVAINMVAFPPMTVDDWAVTSDGSIAVVRGRDYHVDWLGADGTWTSTPRIPYAWEQMNDSVKTALIDSTAAAMQAVMDSMPARMQRAAGATATAPGGATVTVGGERRDAGPGGGGGMVMTFVGPPGGGEGRAGGGGGGGGPTTLTMNVPHVVRAELADVPDYRPAFRQGSVRADVEGNLWIRTNKLVGDRPVYDVVSRDGRLTDRVQLPAFRTIAGFGPGVVYMGVRDSSGVTHLERARVR